MLVIDVVRWCGVVKFFMVVFFLSRFCVDRLLNRLCVNVLFRWVSVLGGSFLVSSLIRRVDIVFELVMLLFCVVWCLD